MPNQGISTTKIQVHVQHPLIAANALTRIDNIADNFKIEGWGQMNLILDRTGIGQSARTRRNQGLRDWKKSTLSFDLDLGKANSLARHMEAVEGDPQNRPMKIIVWYGSTNANRDEVDFTIEETGTPITVGDIAMFQVILVLAGSITKVRA